MEPWEEETSRYHERLAQVENWEPALSSLIKRLPDIPLSYKPSTQGSVAIQLSLLVLGYVNFADQAIAAFLTLWRTGRFTTISLPARLIYELWGATHFTRKTLAQMQTSGEVEKALAKTKRLLFGVRSEVRLPWGGTSDEKSIHVMEFVRSLFDTYPQAEETYDFLCESCHPSHLRLTSWLMAGPPLQNWTNEKFRKHGHSLIERTLEAIEQALRGIACDTTRTLDLALPYIEADITNKEA
ncbi:hypothetical protein ACFLVO_03260 [Chloroflexota bacterium]